MYSVLNTDKKRFVTHLEKQQTYRFEDTAEQELVTDNPYVPQDSIEEADHLEIVEVTHQ